MSKKAPLRLEVTPFSGDPEFLEFFIEQAQSKISLCNWDDNQALTFLKSKLSQQALKFYISSVPCRRASSPEELFTLLRKHFRGESTTSIAAQYNNILYEPAESIYSFANRLESAVRKRFPQLPEPSIAEILSARFVDLIPPHLKVHLHVQKLTSFDKMVESAAAYQEILQSANNNASNPVSLPNSYSTVNNVNVNPESHPSLNCRPSSPVTSISVPMANLNQVQAKSALVCQWCDKSGHSAQRCYKLKKATTKHQSSNFNATRVKYRPQKASYNDDMPSPTQPRPRPKPYASRFSKRNQPASRQSQVRD